MLVLSRMRGEQIVIELPDGQLVMVTAIKSTRWGNMKLGFDAPKDIKVHRREVYETIQAEKKDAA